MPAKNAAPTFDYPEYAEYDLQHNPGYDFLRMLRWCTDAKSEAFNAVFAAYSRNPIAVLLGSAAIEGYTNYAGHLSCKDWSDYCSGAKPFSEKLKRVFTACAKPLDLSQGIYQETTALLKFRGSLAHPRFNHHIEIRSAPPPTIFDHVEFDYPAAKVLDIANRFRDALLADLQLEDLWERQGYVEVNKKS